MKSSPRKVKSNPLAFKAVRTGAKSFEVMFIDRDPESDGPMRAGDVLLFEEWDGEKFTGRIEVRIASFVETGPPWDLIPKYVQVVGLAIPDMITLVEEREGEP